MFYLYSKGCEYAIRALIHFVPAGTTTNLAAKDVCKKAKIPEPFTRKVFQSLVSEKFLEAIQGPGGGYRLREHPEDITILRIIQAVDGKKTFDKCVMGLSKCEGKKPCAIHSTWLKAKKKLLKELESKTLADLVCG